MNLEQIRQKKTLLPDYETILKGGRMNIPPIHKEVMTDKIAKGTIITCPDCNERILEVTQDIFNSMTFKPSYFKSLVKNYEPIPNTAMKCPYCRGEFARLDVIGLGCLHTEKGWV